MNRGGDVVAITCGVGYSHTCVCVLRVCAVSVCVFRANVQRSEQSVGGKEAGGGVHLELGLHCANQREIEKKSQSQ